MKFEKNRRITLNFVMLFSILFYNLFLNKVVFRYDYLLISIFILINLKPIIKFIFSENKSLFTLFIFYFLFFLVQAIVLYNRDLSLSILYSYRYIILDMLYPILLFITVLSLDLNVDEIGKLKKSLMYLSLIVLAFGIINYLFNFNLFFAGTKILRKSNGRIQSFYTNPNSYGMFLVALLSFSLFYYSKKKWYIYFFIFVVMVSISLTYSRAFYFLMIIIVGINFLYHIFKIKKDFFQMLLPILFVIILMFLPDNNYLYLSFTNKVDSILKTNISGFIISCNDAKSNKYNDQNVSNDLEDMYYDINAINNEKAGSFGSRKIYNNIARHYYNSNKIFGVGGLEYYKLQQDYFEEHEIDYMIAGLPHNNYLFFLARDGLIGLVINMLLIINVIYFIYKISKKQQINLILPGTIYFVYLLANTYGDLMIRFDRSIIVYFILALSLKLPENHLKRTPCKKIKIKKEN